MRTITPLFDPIVIEDSIPDIPDNADNFIPPNALSEANDTSKSKNPDTNPSRSGNTCKVGTPITNATVSPMGAAVWSITFDTPPGVGGMTPEVGLAYSSQSGVGNAGWGMNVTGISSITRGTKTLYHDGTVRGMKHDSGDALFLDGRRLLLSSGTEGTLGAVYVQEGDPFTKVKVTSSNSYTGPLSFEVSTPDGRVSLYGSTYDSRLAFVDGDYVLRCHSWYISRQEDPNGNYVEYSYMHDNLTVYPEAITYGKNTHTGNGANNQIRFSYATIHDSAIRTFVIGGVQGSVRKCLDRVRTMTGNSVYREYVLDYAPLSDSTTIKYERLSSITCKNGAGEEMNPVTLDWILLAGTPRTAEVLNVSTDDPYSMVVKQDSLLLATDINGDGIADIVRISNCNEYTSPYGNSELHTYAYVHLSVRDANGDVNFIPDSRFELGYYYDFDNWRFLNVINTIADIDGDGLSDLVFPCYMDPPDLPPFLRLRCFKGKDLRNSCSAYQDFVIPMVAAEEMPPFISGDLDGNGLDDFACLEAKKAQGYYHLDILFCLPSGTHNPVNISLTLPQDPKRLFVGDFNCDGLPDIIALYDGGYKVFYNNSGSTASAIFSNANSTTGSNFGDMWRVEQGDFNGDGLADFVYVDDNSPDYCFAINNGDGTFSISTAITYDIYDQVTGRDNRRFTLTPMDIDRDGVTDLVISKACFDYHGGLQNTDEFTHTVTAWLVSNGSTLSEVRRVRSYHLIDEAGSQNVMLADFDGDGWPELANNGSDWYTNTTANSDGCHIRVYHASGFTPSSGKMTAATDALGAATSFTYNVSSDPGLYTQVYDSIFPLAYVHLPLTLVSTVTRNDGLTGTHTSSYRYAGLKAHLQGKGLLGFSDMAVRDNLTGVTTQSGIWDWNSTHYVPALTYSITSMGYDNDSTTTTISVQS
ncbi:MAG: VCBS repeat-containing protein, partial [Prevotella sp.]|nr:VCBS repeat-containing protein [Prevotella sp.]